MVNKWLLDAHVTCGMLSLWFASTIYGVLSAHDSWLVSAFMYIYIYIYIVKFSTLHKLWDFSYIIRQRSFFISFVIHWDINPEILLLGHEVCWKTLWHFLFFFVLLIFFRYLFFLKFELNVQMCVLLVGDMFVVL